MLSNSSKARLCALSCVVSLFAWPSGSAAQTGVSSRVALGAVSGATLPATCSPVYRNLFLKTGASAGLYECLTTNTWTKVQSGTFSGPLVINTAGGVTLVDDAANTLAQRNGITGQVWSLYRTWANAGVDYERVSLGFTSTVVDFLMQRGGTGVARPFRFGVIDAQWQITTSGHWVPVTNNLYDIGSSSFRVKDYYGSGSISTSGSVNAGALAYFGWGTNKSVTRDTGVDGQFNITNYAGTAGVGFDFATDGTLKIRNRAQNADAAIAVSTVSASGNVAGASYVRTADAGRFITWGTGSPEGVLVGSVGAVFLRTDGGAATTMYIKQTGTGNTGWTAVTP